MELTIFPDKGLTDAQKEPYCARIEQFALFPTTIFTNAFVVLGAVASVVLLFVASTIFFNKALNRHPAPIIGWIVILMSVYYWFNLGLHDICYLNGEVLFARTVFFDTSEASLLRAMNTLTYSYMAFNVFLFNAPAALQMCLLLDMVLILVKPMQRP